MNFYRFLSYCYKFFCLFFLYTSITISCYLMINHYVVLKLFNFSNILILYIFCYPDSQFMIYPQTLLHVRIKIFLNIWVLCKWNISVIKRNNQDEECFQINFYKMLFEYWTLTSMYITKIDQGLFCFSTIFMLKHPFTNFVVRLKFCIF